VEDEREREREREMDTITSRLTLGTTSMVSHRGTTPSLGSMGEKDDAAALCDVVVRMEGQCREKQPSPLQCHCRIPPQRCCRILPHPTNYRRRSSPRHEMRRKWRGKERGGKGKGRGLERSLGR
jgi:hypothetical protein